MSDKKVCSGCGHDQFTSDRLIYQEAVYNGNGEVVTTGAVTPYPQYSQVYTCDDCGKVYNSIPYELVSEAEFHNVIAVQDGA